MATGHVTEAVQDGGNARVTVTVDEDAAGDGLHGLVAYTVAVSVAEMAALPSHAARDQAILALAHAKRQTKITEDVAAEAYLARIRGTTVPM